MQNKSSNTIDIYIYILIRVCAKSNKDSLAIVIPSILFLSSTDENISFLTVFVFLLIGAYSIDRYRSEKYYLVPARYNTVIVVHCLLNGL